MSETGNSWDLIVPGEHVTRLIETTLTRNYLAPLKSDAPARAELAVTPPANSSRVACSISGA
jgi:hypothetical protein